MNTTRKPAAARKVAKTAKTAVTTADNTVDNAVDTVVETATEAKDKIKAKFQEVVEQAKERSRDNRLIVLGAIANSRKAKDERKASLLEAGRAYEPEFEQKIEELKSKFKRDDDKKFSFSLSKKDKKADKAEPTKFQTMLNERMAQSFDRLGLPTRKDFDALSKKVDKLIELQRA